MSKNDQLSITIYRLAHVERILVDQELAPYHIRLNHARVLNYLADNPGSLQKDVAKFLDYQQASLTNLITQLEKRQMVERRPDPNNGRQKRLYLLPKGKEVRQKTDKVFEDLNDALGQIDPKINQILSEKVTYLRQKIDS